MKYPTLYTKNTNGSINIWQLFVENDEFWCVYGQLDGKQITGARTKCLPKNLGKINQTSGSEQASKEAEAEFKKKQEQSGYFLSIGDIDQQTFFAPQLAKSWDNYKDKVGLSTGNWCISPKIDGCRIIVRNSGCFSRNGKELICFNHIRKLLQPLFAKYPDLIFDGECYTHSYNKDFNKIISLIKKSKPTEQDLKDSERLLEYWMFDCGSMDAAFGDRLRFIKWVADEIDDYRIKFVPHDIVKSEPEIEKKLEQYLSDSYEGAMIKNLSALYQNCRTKDCLKYKKFIDQEYPIVDVIEGVGGRSGVMGYIKLKMPNGKTFDANARGDQAYYRELLINKHKYIGLNGIIRFQNFTPGESGEQGVPRFPVMVGIRDYE